MLRRVSFEVGRCVRETGQALDRLGLRVLDSSLHKEKFSRHRQLMNLYEKRPDVAADVVFVAPCASVIGSCQIHQDVSIFYNVVLRADFAPIAIGEKTNLQAGTVVTTSSAASTSNMLEKGCSIGMHVSIGSNCSLFNCTIEDKVKVGSGSVILDGALVESQVVLGPGSVVPPGRRIPSGQMWAGSPVQFVRDLTDEEKVEIVEHAEQQSQSAAQHAAEFLPHGQAYLDVEKLKLQGQL